MGQYYYLMAQLPGISPESPSSMDFGRVRELASRFLDPRDLGILKELSLEPPRERMETGSPLVDAWFSFERSLRLSLARLRSLRLSRDFQGANGDDSNMYSCLETLPIARAALGMDNPLEAERFLDRARFDFIERIASLHFYDADSVFAYALKALLNERICRFDQESGRLSYTSIYNGILGDQE